MTEIEAVAVTVDNHKLAALLFDAIFPLHNAVGIPQGVTFPHQPVMINSLDHYKESLPLIDAYRRAHSEDTEDDGVLVTSINVLARHVQRQFVKEGIYSIPVFSSSGQYENYCQPGAQEAVEITLINAPLIDTRKLEWSHILDIRKDKDFKKKLRNFRLFLADNYKDKPRAYIIDDLHRKLAEHQEACKRHGLHLITSSLSHVMDSKSLLGFSSVAAASILTGQPLIAAASMIGGAILEIGKVAINIAEKRLDLASLKKSAGIAYLVDIGK